MILLGVITASVRGLLDFEATVNVLDDDLTGVSIVSIADTIIEGQTAEFMIMAHNVVTTDRTITLTVADGGANIIDTSGGSYTAATISANTQFVRLPVNTVEQSGTITNASITATLDSGTTDLDTSNASASISVIDKDVPTLSIVESSVRATEGQPFEITIMADPAPVENLTINLTSSAPSGNPFTFSPNPIVMNASSTSTKVVVTAEDVSDDITHRIRIEESIGYNSSLTDLLSVLILDNDNPIATRPNVSISEVAASVAEGSPALVYHIT